MYRVNEFVSQNLFEKKNAYSFLFIYFFIFLIW